jgi:hypothetical protein
MNFNPRSKVFEGGVAPPTPIGLPTLAKMAFDGIDLAPVWNDLVHSLNDTPEDAAVLLDLSTIAMLQERREDRIALQSLALTLRRIYRHAPAGSMTAPLRVLAFMAPGDFMANLPVEFLLANSSIQLDMMYVVPGMLLPSSIPNHDVALVAVAESDENQPILRQIAEIVSSWPVPVVNRPDRIGRLTRNGTWDLLKSAPGVVMPINVRIDRADLIRVAAGDAAIEEWLGGLRFPIIVRPTNSHAGGGLSKVDEQTAISRYLEEQPASDFYIAPFVDYRSPDGLFRKYRIALIDGRAYACHMAISSHWMIHYLNAGMSGSAAKRSEEAHFMASFDREFSVRHATAFGAIAELVDLEYLPFDCGETQDGRLLIFESGTNMIVHSMDPPELFPYKHAQMEKVFTAFQTMIQNHSMSNQLSKMKPANKGRITLAPANGL